MKYRLIHFFLTCLVILETTSKTSCQYLSVPENGVDLGEHFTMKCHFIDSVTDQDILFINWYHSSTSSQNWLYTQNIGETGETKTEWETRDVTGVYTDSYHEVTVQTAIQEDQKLYICGYIPLTGSPGIAEKELEVHVPPLPGSTTIKAEGDIVEGYVCKFICEVNNIRPVDKLKIIWKMGANGQEINSNSTHEENGDGLFLVKTEFSYIFVRDNDGQQMFCIVYWNDLLQYNKSQEIDVLYAPGKATPVHTNYTATAVSSLTVGCRADPGNPNISEFRFLQHDHASFVLTSDTDDIEINISSEERHGEYSCYATNHDLLYGENGTFTIDVSVKPKVISSPGQKINVWYKNPLSIAYNVSAKPRASITWQSPGGTEIYQADDGPDGVGGDRDLLVTTNSHLNWATEEVNLRKGGNGTLNIKVLHDTGNVLYSHEINVEYEPGKAAFSLLPEKVDVLQTVKLSCNPDADPGNPRAYEFSFKDNSDWTLEPTELQTYNLTILNIQQSKNYTCTCFNLPISINVTQEGPASEPKTLDVLVPPAFVNNDGNPEKVICFDEEFALSCDATGKENVTVTWNKCDEGISPGDFHDPVSTSIVIADYYGLTTGQQSTLTRKLSTDTYTCDIIEHYDGEYTCVAKNNGPDGIERTATSNPYVVVTHYPAHWIGENDTVLFAEFNESFLLECNVCARPDPISYVWYRNTSKIDDETDRTYEINRIAMSDFTQYWCEVHNGIREPQQFSLWLNESGPPSLTSETANANKTSTIVPIRWEILTNGGNPPMNFTIGVKLLNEPNYKQWKGVIQHSGDAGGIVIVNVDTLNPNTAYDFNITAKNSRTTGNPYSESKYVRESTNVSPIVNLKQVTVQSEYMEITWEYVTGFVTHQSFNQENVSVTLCIKYWITKDGNETAKTYPDELNCNIAASNNKEKIEDQFDTGREYSVEIIVHENGYKGSNDGQGRKQYTPQNGNGGGVIAGIVISVIFVLVIIVVLAVLLQRGVIQFPSKQPRENDNQSFAEDEGSLDRSPAAESSTHQSLASKTNAYLDDEHVKPLSQSSSGATVVKRIPANDKTKDDKPFTGDPNDTDEEKHYGTIDLSKLVLVEKKPDAEKNISSDNLVYADMDFPKKEKPKIVHNGHPKYILNAGEKISLTVKVEPESDVCMTWLFGNNDVTEKSIDVQKTTGMMSTLTIDHAQREDSGRFTVVAENNYGKTTFNLYTVVIGKLETYGLFEIPSFDDDDEMEIYGTLPNRLTG